jgi:hypothetical protein
MFVFINAFYFINSVKRTLQLKLAITGAKLVIMINFCSIFITTSSNYLSNTSLAVMSEISSAPNQYSSSSDITPEVTSSVSFEISVSIISSFKEVYSLIYFHAVEFINHCAGDSIFIKAKDNDILIYAKSRYSTDSFNFIEPLLILQTYM